MFRRFIKIEIGLLVLATCFACTTQAKANIEANKLALEAQKEAVRDGVPPIELVDGEKLLDMFETLELGLKPKKAFEIDEKFFGDFK